MFGWVELIGYAGSALVAVSLLMRSILRLRFLNLMGALLFLVYGVIIGAVPVIVLNLLTASANIYYLLQFRRTDHLFDLLEVHSRESAFLARFLDFYSEDIDRFFPGFDMDKLKTPISVFILRDVRPTGLFVCEPEGDSLLIHLDYVIPAYRDLRGAAHFYATWDPTLHGNFRELCARTEVAAHAKYLKKMGFERDPERGAAWYVRDVSAEMPTLESAVDLPTIDPEDS